LIKILKSPLLLAVVTALGLMVATLWPMGHSAFCSAPQVF